MLYRTAIAASIIAAANGLQVGAGFQVQSASGAASTSLQSLQMMAAKQVPP